MHLLEGSLPTSFLQEGKFKLMLHLGIALLLKTMDEARYISSDLL